MRRFEEYFRKGLVLSIYMYLVAAVMFVASNTGYEFLFIGTILFIAFILVSRPNANMNFEFILEMKKRDPKSAQNKNRSLFELWVLSFINIIESDKICGIWIALLTLFSFFSVPYSIYQIIDDGNWILLMWGMGLSMIPLTLHLANMIENKLVLKRTEPLQSFNELVQSYIPDPTE